MDLLQQHVRLAVKDSVAALHGQLRDGLGAVAFAGARLADQQGAFARLDELQRGELEDLAPR